MLNNHTGLLHPMKEVPIVLFLFNQRHRVRGDAEAAAAMFADCQPQYLDVVPLNLEEVFIYELGGVEHEVKSILL